ncbi:MAG: D-hexose-6-phosphate mutarotase, partial [Moraxellaceae bacterium]
MDHQTSLRLPHFQIAREMNMSSSNSSITTNLQNLVAQNSFLEVTSSQEQFPGSKGNGLPLIRVKTSLCTAVIALQGAHLLHFNAHDGKPSLWVSPNCDFTKGTALRGGVPVCLPWFGPNSLDPKKPKHGFARNRDWQLDSARLSPEGNAELIFTFNSPANELFQYDFVAQLKFTLGKTAKLELDVSNVGDKEFNCSWVLHSYFPATSLTHVRVKGLAGKTYLDNLENHAPKIQDGDVTFSAEVDRVYPNIENELSIESSTPISIKHHNCPSVVVWNPGAENASKIADIGAGNEQNYVCV